MFLTSYTFTGPSETLLEGWRRLFAHYGAGDLDLHLAIVTETGLTVIDACPDRDTMERFASSADFADVLLGCNLPKPVITPLGTLHAGVVRDGTLDTFAQT